MQKSLKKKQPPVGGVMAPNKKTRAGGKPQKIKEGTVLTDYQNGKWYIATTIGTGGFGDIYKACRLGENAYEYAVKCELFDGPIYKEMLFYSSHAKVEDIECFKRVHNLKSLGMPHMIASGQLEIDGIKHHFLVMPRYGIDVTKQFIANGCYFPVGSVYRLTLQMLYVYEYVHSKGYVHSDLKGANIVLGDGEQAYLVDYGLTAPFNLTYKPDPRKKHNGTVEFTSRDAHLGMFTRRGDLEVLAWNLIKWLGGYLPWVKEKVLSSPSRVATGKRKFMKNVGESLREVFRGKVPGPLFEYFAYVKRMKHNEQPDYKKCRQFFINALIALKMPIDGELVLKI